MHLIGVRQGSHSGHTGVTQGSQRGHPLISQGSYKRATYANLLYLIGAAQGRHRQMCLAADVLLLQTAVTDLAQFQAHVSVMSLYVSGRSKDHL